MTYKNLIERLEKINETTNWFFILKFDKAIAERTNKKNLKVDGFHYEINILYVQNVPYSLIIKRL